MFFLLLIPSTDAFCEIESFVKLNLTNISQYEELGYTHEYGNSISSLVYTLFGFIGLIPKHNTGLYYLVMYLFIACGLASFCHHYYCCTTDWALAVDIISMEMLASISLYYIINGIIFQYIIIKKIFEILSITGLILMLMYHKVIYGPRGQLFKATIGFIVASQTYISLYLLYIKSPVRYKVFISELGSGVLFVIGVVFWFIDEDCPQWMWRTINGHSLWHVCVAWALFNSINISSLFHALIRKDNFKWITPFKKCPWFIFLIILNKKNRIRYSETKLQQIIISSPNKTHRRSRTIG